MSRILIIRFGALGDLCICGWFVSGLAAATGAGITLATKARFAPLAERFAGVDAVASLDEGGPTALWRLARSLGRGDHTHVLDAHGVLRSHGLAALMARRPDARIRKDTRARLALIRSREGTVADGPAGLDRSLLDRFIALAPAAGLEQPTPRAPLIHLRPAGEAPFRIGLAPGARWPSKRWPANRFSGLLDNLLEVGAPPVTLLLGPDEQAWFDGGPLTAAAARYPNLDVICEAPLPKVADALARCHVTLTNDSGLLHLSEAVGTPVVALFGPTVRAFGYFPLMPQSRVLERDLDCRPCSRTGSRPCHRGDLACLEEITVADVRDAVLSFRPGAAT